MSRPTLLSIVIVGRNDDYLGGYRYRLQICLDFLAMNLKRLNRLEDVEVIYVDWNSDGLPLSEVIEVTDDAAGLLRFVIVTPEVARSRNSIVDFFTTCAVNVGVRRAKGEFIMLADSDCIMPLPSLKALLEVLDGTLPTTNGPKEHLIYPIPRHQIPGPISSRKPNVPAWEQILIRLFPSRRKELPGADCLGGFSAAQLMHRSLWFEFGGYNEKLDRAWGWSDNELMLRVTRKYPWMDLGYYGVVAFHIQHIQSGPVRARDPGSINSMLNTYDANPNEVDWGLADIPLPELSIKGQGNLPRLAKWRDIDPLLLTGEGFVAACNTPEVQKLVGHTTFEKGTRSADPEIAAVDDAMATAIVVAVTTSRCRNLLVAGAIRPMALTAAIVANPGMDLILTRCWQSGDLKGEAVEPSLLSVILYSTPFYGYGRILNGYAADTFKILADTEKYLLPIEMAIIDIPSLGAESEHVFGLILDQLPKAGMVVLHDRENHVPEDAQSRAVYFGRLISGSRQPFRGQRKPFLQSADEEKLGQAFVSHTFPFWSGVKLIVKCDTASEIAS